MKRDLIRDPVFVVHTLLVIALSLFLIGGCGSKRQLSILPAVSSPPTPFIPETEKKADGTAPSSPLVETAVIPPAPETSVTPPPVIAPPPVVPPPPAPPVIVIIPKPELQFTATAEGVSDDRGNLTVIKKTEVQFRWSSQYASECRSSLPLFPGTTSGEVLVPVAMNVSYSMTCSGVGGEVTIQLNISTIVCDPNGGGVEVDGYCWYRGPRLTVSCTETCQSRGGCNLEGTQGYIGSNAASTSYLGANPNNCLKIANTVYAATGVKRVDDHWGSVADWKIYRTGFKIGCYSHNEDVKFDTGGPTTCEATGFMPDYNAIPGITRFCACNR